MSKRAPQIPLNEFLATYKRVQAEGGTIDDFAAALDGGRSVASTSTRLSQVRQKYPAVEKVLEEFPLKSKSGGGRKSFDEADLLAIFED